MRDYPIVVALDYESVFQIPDVLAAALQERPDIKLKIGPIILANEGPGIMRRLMATGHQILVDLKFHDTPNTVAKTVEAYARLGVWGMTLHTAGGEEMMRAAVVAKNLVNPDIKLFGVTVLTSQTTDDLDATGVNAYMRGTVIKRADLAKKCGINGVVCAGESLEYLLSPSLKTLVPGIVLDDGDVKPSGQHRTMSLEDALKKKATYCVVGRALTASKEPMQVLYQIDRIVERSLGV